MYSRFQKASTPPRVLTIAGSAIALALACWYEIDSEDGTYTPSIIMLSLMWLAPGLIAVGLDLLFMLYALATLIVVSSPLGKNTTLKNMWIPVIFSISSVAGHWMKEKANVKENIDYDLEFFDGYSKWLSSSIWCGVVAFACYFGAWTGSNDTNLFWGIGWVCIAVWIVFSFLDYKFRDGGTLKERDYGALKAVLDFNFEQSNEWIIVKLSLAMASTVFVGAMLERAKYSEWSIVALIAWIFAMFSIHRAKKYFEDYYVYKKY